VWFWVTHLACVLLHTQVPVCASALQGVQTMSDDHILPLDTLKSSNNPIHENTTRYRIMYQTSQPLYLNQAFYYRKFPFFFLHKVLISNVYFLIMCSEQLSQYSVWLQTGRLGFDPRQRQRIFPLASVSRPALTLTQLAVQQVLGILFPGHKVQPGHDADGWPLTRI
jgi:hypothetical protein